MPIAKIIERGRISKKEIVDYWFSIVDECGLSVDEAEAHERCWRCGCENTLERCHIIPASLGGEDKPSNLVLFCHRCHIENPNISDPEIIGIGFVPMGHHFMTHFGQSKE